MFGFLKKKIGSFTEKIRGKVEEKAPASEGKPEPEAPVGAPETKPAPQPAAPAKSTAPEKQAREPETEKRETEAPQAPPAPEKIPASKPEKGEAKPGDERAEPPAPFQKTQPAPQKAPELPRAPEKPEVRESDIAGDTRTPEEKLRSLSGSDRRDLRAKTSIRSGLKSVFSRTVTLEARDVEDFLFEFELSLLESDVEQDAANAIVQKIKEGLLGQKVSKSDVTSQLKERIREALLEVMRVEEPKPFWETVDAHTPCKILFLGPNGAGKTTSIAKITHALKQRGHESVLASADTFRAGSIEQIETHAKRLGVRVVRHQYGADPAAVAFDAVKAAEASGAKAVLVDSAGRQDTNKNLMAELKKIDRVIKPDLKIYVGEAYTGQALLTQAKKFDEEIGLDGFVLSKIDTDAKGGTAISLLHALKKPIYFVGTGQRYEDLVAFAPEYIADRVVG